jgi:hypothetical protein
MHRTFLVAGTAIIASMIGASAICSVSSDGAGHTSLGELIHPVGMTLVERPEPQAAITTTSFRFMRRDSPRVS